MSFLWCRALYGYVEPMNRSVSLFVCRSVFVSLFRSVCLSLWVSLSFLHVCWFSCQSVRVCESACHSVCLPVCQYGPICLSVCLSLFLSAFPTAACLFLCLPVCLSTYSCLFVYVSVCLTSCMSVSLSDGMSVFSCVQNYKWRSENAGHISIRLSEPRRLRRIHADDDLYLPLSSSLFVLFYQSVCISIHTRKLYIIIIVVVVVIISRCLSLDSINAMEWMISFLCGYLSEVYICRSSLVVRRC